MTFFLLISSHDPRRSNGGGGGSGGRAPGLGALPRQKSLDSSLAAAQQAAHRSASNLHNQ
jgi:hypothetical protein